MPRQPEKEKPQREIYIGRKNEREGGGWHAHAHVERNENDRERDQPEVVHEHHEQPGLQQLLRAAVVQLHVPGDCYHAKVEG